MREQDNKQNHYQSFLSKHFIDSYRIALLLVAFCVFSSSLIAQSSGSDATLTRTRELDRQGRDAQGQLAQLAPTEHLRRASVYMSNRAFTEARKHYQIILDQYPTDAAVGPALFFTGRSYFQEKLYEQAIPYYARVSRDFKETLDGREGLSALGTTLLRLERFDEAVEVYRSYTEIYPNGEKVEAVHLNIIDTLREGGKNKEAIEWITITREKFPNTATATNAVFARLRLDISQKDWQQAVRTAEELRSMQFPKGTMTDRGEVAYLRAFALEKSGRKEEAIAAYLAIPDGIGTYHGWLATERLLKLIDGSRRSIVLERLNRVKAEAARVAGQYPAPYRDAILRATTKRKVDPRLVLALMKQESSFRVGVKSSAAARGLLQLTIDTASKYSAPAGYKTLKSDDLYQPETSITIGSEYIAALQKLFPNLSEAVAASYNGGEDNAARWLKRSKQTDAAIFAAEVGFAETKDYVFKVMANYRAYQLLYDANLKRQ
jgi:soluble lytic murein transglycosylase